MLEPPGMPTCKSKTVVLCTSAKYCELRCFARQTGDLDELLESAAKAPKRLEEVITWAVELRSDKVAESMLTRSPCLWYALRQRLLPALSWHCTGAYQH